MRPMRYAVAWSGTTLGETQREMETIRLNITGMSCGHCKSAVENALRRQRGVRTAEVDLQGGTARVEFDPAAVSTTQLTAAVEEEGYTADVG